MTVRTGQPLQAGQEGKARTGQPAQGSQDWTFRLGQPTRDYLKSTAKLVQLEKDKHGGQESQDMQTGKVQQEQDIQPQRASQDKIARTG
jgi:hypothetical protein